MKRGELWTLQDRNYASKPRPVVIVQADSSSFNSVILCLFTSFESNTIATRVKIEPSAENGLQKISYVMTDKIVTVDRAMLGECIGSLSESQMRLVSGKLAKVLEIHKSDIEE
ncbi:putative endoribonuclease MazF [Campylobacterota bacterium]|nr:putative endoribonuclease MazF [Campylobacterota bacterium]